jgi:hypothetical protein
VIRSDANAAVAATIATCAYMVAYWILLWRGAVNWTQQRLRRTTAMTLVAALAGVIVGVAIAAVLPYDKELGACGGVLSGAIVWIILTILAWRETPRERAERLSRAGADALVCPTCGYNLTGLSESRCPECGAQFTLNELLAGQPSRAAAEVETG